MPLDGRVSALNLTFKHKGAVDVMKHAVTQLGQTSLVSSFGAQSVVLLHMAAQINPDIHVVFIDTDLLFPETLAYQQQVADVLGLRNVETIRTPRAAVFEHDNENLLHLHDTEACCALRKTKPLLKVLQDKDAWITGRKRVQGGERAALDYFELDRTMGALPRIKVNPLAHWSRETARDYISQHALPRHPLVNQGYPSIGCTPCTTRMDDGENPSAGRWRTQNKSEYGLHFNTGQNAQSEHAS